MNYQGRSIPSHGSDGNGGGGRTSQLCVQPPDPNSPTTDLNDAQSLPAHLTRKLITPQSKHYDPHKRHHNSYRQQPTSIVTSLTSSLQPLIAQVTASYHQEHNDGQQQKDDIDAKARYAIDPPSPKTASDTASGAGYTPLPPSLLNPVKPSPNSTLPNNTKMSSAAASFTPSQIRLTAPSYQHNHSQLPYPNDQPPTYHPYNSNNNVVEHHGHNNGTTSAVAMPVEESSKRPADGYHVELDDPMSPAVNESCMEEEALQKDQIESTFCEMVEETPSTRDKLLVVLDCANIGWNYGRNEGFSAKGVEIAIEALVCFPNVEVKAFLPASYVRAKARDGSRGNAMMQTDDVDAMQHLIYRKLITEVPSEDSDDAYILNYARDHQGFIISNDLFRDHIHAIANPSVRLSMKLWLQENRCSYTFVGDEFMVNPSSKLRFVLMQEPLAAGSAWTASAQSALPSSCSSEEELMSESVLIRSLSQACEELYQFNKAWELQSVLTVRAKLYMEAGYYQLAHRDLKFILDHIAGDHSEDIRELFRDLELLLSPTVTAN